MRQSRPSIEVGTFEDGKPLRCASSARDMATESDEEEETLAEFGLNHAYDTGTRVLCEERRIPDAKNKNVTVSLK